MALAPLPDGHRVSAPDELHYATLYLPLLARPLFAAVEQLREQVDAIPYEVADPGVARIKLGWWQEEFTQLERAEPRHPLGRWLQEATPAQGSAVARALGCWADAAAERLEQPSPTIASEQAVLTPAAEALTELRLRLRGLSLAPAACTALARVAVARQLLWEAARTAPGRAGAATTLLTRCGDPETFNRLFAELRGELAAAIAAVPRATRRRAVLELSLARYALTVTDNLPDPARTLASARPEATPLTRLGIAWRTRYFG